MGTLDALKERAPNVVAVSILCLMLIVYLLYRIESGQRALTREIRSMSTNRQKEYVWDPENSTLTADGTSSDPVADLHTVEDVDGASDDDVKEAIDEIQEKARETIEDDGQEDDVDEEAEVEEGNAETD